MRVTNLMLVNMARYDLEGLREKYLHAQSAVNGRVLDRPSEDPQRVVESMDLAGAKMRLERYQRSGDDAKEWLSVTEISLNTIVDDLQAAREIAVQLRNPTSLEPDARHAMVMSLTSIRDALVKEMNAQHRGQYLFSGLKDTKPFDMQADGSVVYNGTVGEAPREIASDQSVSVNVAGISLTQKGDFVKTISDMITALQSGDLSSIGGKIDELDQALGNVVTVRSEVGVRVATVEKYYQYAVDAIYHIEDRLGKLSGGDLETAVMDMAQAQQAYQTALASFSKALPMSLMDYIMG